jgi:hypothetical protein
MEGKKGRKKGGPGEVSRGKPADVPYILAPIGAHEYGTVGVLVVGACILVVV